MITWFLNGLEEMTTGSIMFLTTAMKMEDVGYPESDV